MENEQLKKSHKLTLDNRKGLSLTGVVDVVNFDLQCVVLRTGFGTLTVKGEELHVNKLSVERGDVEINGTINSLVYSGSKDSKEKAESLFAHLFK